ncbi:thermonuclease family protein [Pannonibacter carbonis]|uniref:thermonuclease family protein n=1 Tax=Pannonibacter carbonis TaxID=2067569 RepID=UPI001FCA6390|nr:thermonuclease family protein [Pannonibacter carbonis]
MNMISKVIRGAAHHRPARALLFAGTVFLALACFALAAVQAGQAGTGMSGARVIDGDTIELAGEKLRLEGIDAPELAQTCALPSGRSYPCGKEAARALTRLLAAGPVACIGETRDDYGRLLATCHAAGVNVNAEMVLSGHAFAFRRYSQSYIAEETEARRHKAGLFAGAAETPWDFRARKWATADKDAPPGDCRIKGNISKAGRIYHMPWSPAYSRTRIDARQGERWFCTEAEALSAGWRAPR